MTGNQQGAPPNPPPLQGLGRSYPTIYSTEPWLWFPLNSPTAMTAILCRKRSFFEDLPEVSNPLSKRPRFCPSVFPPSAPAPRKALLAKLKEVFPDMEQQLLEKALEESGDDDMDSIVRKLHDLRLQRPSAVPSEWVELLLREVMGSSSLDDARARAGRVLEHVGNSITSRVEAHQKENITLKEHVQTLVRENSTLKSLVVKQHERQKKLEENDQEVEQLKQLVAKYQEQLRKLEVDNYALTLHLKQALQSTSNGLGHFNSHVF